MRKTSTPQIEDTSSPPLSDGTEHSVKRAGNGSLPDREGETSPLLSFFIPRLGQGGAEQVTITLVNGLTARGYNVELLLTQFEGTLQSRLASEVDVVALPPSRAPVFGVAMNLPALMDYLRKREPAVIFSHLSRTNVVSLAASRLLDTDTTVVPTQHSAFGAEMDRNLKTRVLEKLVPLLYPSADRIIAVSEGVADSIVERTTVDRDDISVLYNPIDIDFIREQNNRDVDHEWIEDDDLDVILFAGRLVRAKDLKTWIRVFELVHAENPDTRAIIMGKGPLHEELQAYVDRLGLADVVSMPGYVENPYGYMHASDVFLLSSRYEGLPSVLIEALACGCPIVATDCPSGPREILVDGKYGRLRPVGDVEGLAEAVVECLNDPTPTSELRDRADDFATEAVLDDYERFLEEHVFD